MMYGMATGTEISASSWGVLKESALALLDAKGQDRLAARRRHAARVIGKMGKAVPFDEEKVVRFLEDYARGKRYADAVRGAGLTKLEILTAFELWPECRVVYDYVCARNAEAREMDNEEFVDSARAALKELLTKPGCDLNAKAVLTTLERLDRKSFGDPRVKDGGDDARRAEGGGGITLNIVADAAKVCAKPPAEPTGKAQVFIDV